LVLEMASLSKFLSNENNSIAKVGSKKPSGYSQIRNELTETSPTSHHNPCFEVANSEVRLRAQSSLSGSAARPPKTKPGLGHFRAMKFTRRVAFPFTCVMRSPVRWGLADARTVGRSTFYYKGRADTFRRFAEAGP
jgi:hypothetical protein